jgi:hypothetical protein
MVWLAAASGSAHDPGLSELSLRHGAFGVRFEWVIGNDELPGCAADSVSAGSRPLRVSCRRYDATHTALTGALAAFTGGELQLELKLLQHMPRGHRVFVRELDRAGRLLDRRLLDRTNRTLRSRIERPGATQLWPLAGVSFALIALPWLLHRRRGARS